jgi:hypothetical protein
MRRKGVHKLHAKVLSWGEGYRFVFDTDMKPGEIIALLFALTEGTKGLFENDCRKFNVEAGTLLKFFDKTAKLLQKLMEELGVSIARLRSLVKEPKFPEEFISTSWKK